jgi:hypothetical protein
VPHPRSANNNSVTLSALPPSSAVLPLLAMAWRQGHLISVPPIMPGRPRRL